MRRPTLGQKLRAIVLAVPFAGGMACGGSGSGGGACANGLTEVFLLSSIDAGLSGGSSCEPACQILMGTSAFSCGCTDIPCSFTSLDGGPAVSCDYQTPSGCCCITGRRPPGLLAPEGGRTPNALAALFTNAARLEAASILAFHLLARELSAHGAPAALIRSARVAARDEVRHARATAALARRYGAEPLRPRLGKFPQRRSLAAIAVENAVEGCVRETYGALVALWQARTAADPAVAGAIRPIARDETRHATLAWKVAAWAAPRLGPAARRRVERARADAFAELRREATRPVPAPLVALAGLPPPAIATRLLDALEPEIAEPWL